MPWTIEQRSQEELLDQPGWDDDELRESLRLISNVNRTLGGSRLVSEALAGLGSDATLLDVGTGNADLLGDLGRNKKRHTHHVGVDLHPQIVRMAERRGRTMDSVSVLRADAQRLPFADNSFDAVVSTLMLHHFDGPGSITVLKEMARVARRKVVVADLERTPWALFGARILSRTVWRHNRLTRLDGPLSVQRAWTRRELSDIAAHSGLARVRVTRHFPYGLVLDGTPSHE